MAIKWHRRRLRQSLKTHRERHLLDHLIAGESNQEIALALGLTYSIVSRSIADLRTEARTLGISQFDLRALKSPEVPS